MALSLNSSESNTFDPISRRQMKCVLIVPEIALYLIGNPIFCNLSDTAEVTPTAEV